MPLFSIPLSGLDAQSNALSVIANNLANLNTDGYERRDDIFPRFVLPDRRRDGRGKPNPDWQRLWSRDGVVKFQRWQPG